MSSYMQERDSIMQENKAKTQQLEELNGVLETIATGLDSIAIQENILSTIKGVMVSCLIVNRLLPI